MKLPKVLLYLFYNIIEAYLSCRIYYNGFFKIEILILLYKFIKILLFNKTFCFF